MIHILEAFAQENIHTSPTYFKKGTKYAQLMGERADLYTQISKKLSQDDLDLVDKLLDIESELTIQNETNSFSYGYQLGSLIMIEVFTKMDRLTGIEEPPTNDD